jgi:MFS family permease
MATAAPERAQAGRLKRYFKTYRTLDVYPVGPYRWGLLLLTLSAQMIGLYDLSFGGLLPLFISSLHFSAKDFSYFLIFAVVLSGLAAAVGGPLADRHGRVMIIDLCLGGIIILTFCNLLMTDFWSFVIVRGFLNLVSGLMAGAVSGLIRDMSPRLGRGTAFGLYSCGAGIAHWLWTFVPGVTLPYLHTWQSQIWIMGILATLLYIPVLLYLKDLSPSLRLTIIESESSVGMTAHEAVRRSPEVPRTARMAFGALLGRWDIWVLALGSAGLLALTITMQTFGPLMYVQAFKFTPANAAKITSYFFLAHVLMFLPSGYLSDVLRMRKAVIFPVSGLMLVVLVWWISGFAQPISPVSLGIISLTLGALTSAAAVPWYALYSEFVEDISPALQATGWSFFHLIFRSSFAIIGLAQPYVAQDYGWSTWMWIVAMMLFLYLISLLMVRGYWRQAVATTVASPVPAQA